MILYHGSYMVVDKPNLLHSRKNVDFGVVFYTTKLREQAVKWCQRFVQDGKECHHLHWNGCVTKSRTTSSASRRRGLLTNISVS